MWPLQFASHHSPMDHRRVVTLIQHYLKEQGYGLTLSALQEDANQEFVEHAVPSGELASILAKHAEAETIAGMAKLSVLSKDQKQDDDELSRPGNSQIPNGLERTYTAIHSGNILTVRTDPSHNIIITGGTDRTVRVIDSLSGDLLRTLTHHKAGVLSVDIHPTERNLILTSGMDATHHLVDLNEPFDEKAVIKSWKDHSKFVVRAKWSPDGNYFATCSFDKTACLYGPKGDQKYALLHRFQHRGNVEAVTFSHDSQYAVFSSRDDNYLHYIKLADCSFTSFNMNANKDDFVSFTAMELAFSPDSKYLLVATDKSRLILFRAFSADQVLNFYGVENNEYSQPRIAWHPSGKYFYVTSSERLIVAFDIATRSIVCTLDDHTKNVRDIYYDTAQNCLWSCSYDETVRQWIFDEAML